MENLLIELYYTILVTIALILITLKIYYMFIINPIIINIKNIINKHETENKAKLIVIIDEFWEKKYTNVIKKNFPNNIIDINDSEGFQKILQGTIIQNIKNLDICIESNGGYVKPNDIIVCNLLDYDGIINTYVPNYAFSASSLIALCGNKIYLNETAVLGPTDPITEIKGKSVSVESLLKLKKQKNINSIEESLIIEINDLEKVYIENKRTLKRIFRRHQKSNNYVYCMANIFGSGKWSHGSPFTKKFLVSHGFSNEKNENMKIMEIILDNIFKLNSLTY